MTRFRRVERPDTVPHLDIHDRDSSNPAWDLGVDLVGYDGAVFVKEHYIKEIARLCGMIDIEKYEAVVKENELLKKNATVVESITQTTDKLGEMRNEFLDYLAAYRTESGDSGDDGSSNDHGDEDIQIEGDSYFDFGESTGLGESESPGDAGNEQPAKPSRKGK